jgi:adenylosuccinate synthase
VLSGLPEVKICTGYRTPDGREVAHFPASLALLESCEPVYETLPGWSEPITGARTLDDLPRTARDYVLRIEAALGVPADLVGVGPSRDATIERANPFDRPRRS